MLSQAVNQPSDSGDAYARLLQMGQLCATQTVESKRKVITCAKDTPNVDCTRENNESPVKILFVDTSGREGGAERSLTLLIEAMVKDGVRVTLVTPRKALSCEGRIFKQIQIVRTCRFLPRRRPSVSQALDLACRWVGSMLVILWAIIMTRPRLVHANTTNAMLVALIPARLTKRPLVWHVRDLANLGWIGRLCGRQASTVVAVSKSIRQHLVNQGIPQDKVHVVYNGVDPSFGQVDSRCEARRTLREKFGFPHDAFVCLNLGQFVPWKRQDVFLQVAADVSRQCDRARFLVIGGEPWGECRLMRLELDGLARQLGVADRVVVSDWQEEIQSILAAVDVMVHTAEAEPFGRVIIEAMQAGVPVVAVRAGGPMEIVQEEQSGLLVDAGDIKGLSSQILRVLRDELLAKRLAEGGQQRVREAFTAEETARSIGSLYRQLLLRDRTIRTKAAPTRSGE